MSTPTSSSPQSSAAPVATASNTQSAQTKTGAAAPAAEATAAPTAPRMIKLKLEGREVELPESEVISYAQQGKVASQRFQEASALKKQAEETLAFAKANPKEFFERTGMNARQWAEEYLIQELQMEAMSPEQKKARENEDKLRKYEDEKKQTEEKTRKEQMQKLEDEHRTNYDQMFTKALTESGLPRTAFTVKRMAELQLINVKNKYELSASQLAKLVREDYSNEQKSLLTAFDGDQLMEFLGPDLVKKLSKAQIAKLKAKGNPVSQPAQRQASNDDSKGLTWAEYRKRNRKI